jgi:hypothetical protein
MARTVALILFAVVLVAIGWIAGAKAQSSSPDFELIVNAPAGETTVECARGCKLAWVERGFNPNQGTDAKFTYSCGAVRCLSGKVGGWISR